MQHVCEIQAKRASNSAATYEFKFRRGYFVTVAGKTSGPFNRLWEAARFVRYGEA